MKKTLAILTALALLLGLLGGCASQNSPTATPSSGGAGTTDGTESTEPTAQEADEMFTNRDKRTDYDAADSISVTLNGSTATVNGDGVSVDGSTVTFTAAGTYVITGTLSDGMLLVDAPEDTKLQLVFCGVSITSASSAALYIRQADKVFVTLAEGTDNTLANGGVFTAVDDNNIDGAVFSKEDLSFNGSGTLTVTSPAENGIVCKDDLVLAGGVYAITSASHAIDANDSVRVTDSTLTLDAGKDGIHAAMTRIRKRASSMWKAAHLPLRPRATVSAQARGYSSTAASMKSRPAAEIPTVQSIPPQVGGSSAVARGSRPIHRPIRIRPV